MDWRHRAVSASASVVLAIVVVVLNRSVDGTGMVTTASDWIALIVASAVIGALVLDRFVAPRRRNWLWPLLGGLLSAMSIMVLALLPDAVIQIAVGNASVFGVILTLLLAALYTAVIAGPVFVVGALVLHGVLRAVTAQRG